MSEKTHTDICKSNNANKAIQGTIFAFIARGGIERISEHLNGRTILSIADVREILTSTQQCLAESIELYTESQTNASKRVVQRYAQTQFTQINSIFNNNEMNNDNVVGLSKFIVTEKMKKLYKVVLNVDPSGKFFHYFNENQLSFESYTTLTPKFATPYMIIYKR